MATDAPGYPPNLLHLVLFLIGAIVMRGAGCTYNDILDRDIDAAVLRTRNRPIPSGQVTVAAGLGANVLLGGSNNTVALQPVSVATSVGLNFALGVAELHLRAGP